MPAASPDQSTPRDANPAGTSDRPGRVGADDLIARRIALRDEPVTGGNMAPPFALDAGRPRAVEHIIAPLGVAADIGVGHRAQRTAISELGHRAWTVQRTDHDFHLISVPPRLRPSRPSAGSARTGRSRNPLSTRDCAPSRGCGSWSCRTPALP